VTAPEAETRETDDRPMPPAIDGGTVADRLGALFAVDGVRDGVWLWLFRRMMRYAMNRAHAAAARATRNTSWLTLESDTRLATPDLRTFAWTGVLEDDVRLDEISRAAALIVAALEFRAEIQSPSCLPRRVEQCERLFDTTLIPREDRFEVHRGAGRHVLVGIDGKQWAVDVIDESGAIRDEGDIADDLRACAAAKRLEKTPLLALTSTPRAEAALIWKKVAHDSADAATLLVDAIFSVFLDPSAPNDVDACGLLAQGGAPDNRSFWHATQLIVFRNGRAAVVGSYVAGVEGEGALDFLSRLGAVRASGSKKRAPRKRRSATDEPKRLVWTVEPRHADALKEASRGSPIQAGGLVRVAGFGRSEWQRAGVSSEAATLVALRLALHTVVPELDDLDCMVNLAHFQAGTARRVSTSTPEMRALLRAEAERQLGEAPAESGDPLVLAALVAEQGRIRKAKRLETGRLALEYAQFSLKELSAGVRFVLRLVVSLLGIALASKAAAKNRRELFTPKVTVVSSVPARSGLSAAGRFGVLAPPRSIWIHYTIDEHETRFVLQLGREHLGSAKRLRDALAPALGRVLSAARSHRLPEGGEGSPDVSASLRIASRDLALLANSLRQGRDTKERTGSEVSSSS
jgi:hypothetical protein